MDIDDSEHIPPLEVAIINVIKVLAIIGMVAFFLMLGYVITHPV